MIPTRDSGIPAFPSPFYLAFGFTQDYYEGYTSHIRQTPTRNPSPVFPSSERSERIDEGWGAYLSGQTLPSVRVLPVQPPKPARPALLSHLQDRPVVAIDVAGRVVVVLAFRDKVIGDGRGPELTCPDVRM